MTEKPRVLIVEPNHKLAAEVSRHLWNAPLVVDTTSTLAGALVRVREFNPDVVAAPVDERFDGEGLCRQLKEIDRGSAVLLAYPNDRSQADQLAEDAGADGWLYLPYNIGALVSCIKWAVRLRDATEQMNQMRNHMDEAALAPSPRGTPQARKVEVEFFKRTLLMEVRRSKRYRYPLAVLCVGVDRFASRLGRLPVHVRTSAMSKLLKVIHGTVRDIDLAVQDGDERFLVCLPQTDQDGARYVGHRLRELLPSNCDDAKITVSIGLAAYDGSGANVSFKGLFQHATGCLERAQKLGGDRLEVLSHS
ncbi:MAG: diguanylate cyclase [Deltaproteobacteria bacterium]|nr:diguanylate cyclase [Deltaproteobacteria bacterium]